MTIVIVFTFLGVLLPFAQSSIGESSSDYRYNVLNGKMGTGDSSITVIFTVFFSILKMFTFMFGSVPYWLDLLLFMPFRITAYVIIATKIRG